MVARFVRAALLSATVAATAALVGCNEHSVKDFAPKANMPVPPALIKKMGSLGMARNAPIMARIFKEEGKVEIWKQKANGRYAMLADFDICKMSGQLGPKFIEGDRQAPEGFYVVRPGQMNPNSNYHLSFNIGYPNAYDRTHGRTGSNLMVHGGCSSSGCFSMTDNSVEVIYALARDAFKGGQTEFQIQSYPFRMTAQNMARYRNDPNYGFWRMLKEGNDHFEITKVPPKVDVCEKRYVFNQTPAPGATFSPTGACPSSATEPALASAYQTYQSTYEAAFSAALGKAGATPLKPTILGIQEAKVVADWTKRRARGERISLEPPDMRTDGSVAVTSRMGRIDSEGGRKMAAKEAAEAEKKRLAEEKARVAAAEKAAREAEKAARLQPPTVEVTPAPPPVETVEAEPDPADGSSGMLSSLRKRITNIF